MLTDASGSGSLNSSATLCKICSDKATGKHYGAISCDGCKGFFRRTVRQNPNFDCRFSRSCVIDREKRNTCRHCRFDKCLKAGMLQQAVQSERDRICAKKSRMVSCNSSSKTFAASLTPISLAPSFTEAKSLLDNVHAPVATNQLEAVKQAEYLLSTSATSQASETRLSPRPTTANSSSAQDAAPRLATVADLADAIREQLLLLVEWAKALPPFIELSIDDQVSLLRAYAAKHLLLGIARRSLPYKDVLLLSNDACIPREHASEIHDVNHVVFDILDELVEPMRELQLDDTENGCLKALLFFNPNAFGLCNKSKVKEARYGFLEAFHEYVTKKRSQKDNIRFGKLLLLLPPLQDMSKHFIEDLQLATLFGRVEFDKLLEELLLATAALPFLADGFSASAKKIDMTEVAVTTDVP